MSFRKTLLAATMLALPLAAQAQTVTGLYVAGGAGWNWMSNTSSNVATDGGIFGFGLGGLNFGSTNVRFDTGWVGLASVGWGFGNGLRADGEISYRNNNVNSVRIGNDAAFNVGGQTGSFFPGLFTGAGQGGGSVRNTAVMVNAIYDFNFRWVMPYLGAGIGVTWIDWNSVTGSVTAPSSPGLSMNQRISGTSSQFAYQGIAGLAFPIPAVPGLAITAEYRYFASLSPSVSTGVRYNVPGLSIPLGTSRSSFDNTHQSALIGVRYNFCQRAPAPAPVAAAPAPARSFLVFFDFGRDDLTARAREIIGQAAAASRSQQVTRIEVAGHTDTVGSAQYNQGLSQRRANNVAAELVHQGVPRQSIVTAAYGFTRPLVPTGPNVREPQNRRVEIVLR